MKLKTTIVQEFKIEEDLLEDLDFTFDLPVETIKTKVRISEITKVKINKSKKDVSTRLF